MQEGLVCEGSFIIPDGMAWTDGDNIYTGTLSSDQIKQLQKKKLTPTNITPSYGLVGDDEFPDIAVYSKNEVSSDTFLGIDVTYGDERSFFILRYEPCDDNMKTTVTLGDPQLNGDSTKVSVDDWYDDDTGYGPVDNGFFVKIADDYNESFSIDLDYCIRHFQRSGDTFVMCDKANYSYTFTFSPAGADDLPERYANEWVDGSWFDKAGRRVIGRTGTWKNTKKGWIYMVGAKALRNCWQKIDGDWYYFKSTGYAAKNEFVKGWWIGKDCVQRDPVKCSWHKTKKGWWYGVSGGWYAKGKTYVIDGVKYNFNAAGYCTNP